MQRSLIISLILFCPCLLFSQPVKPIVDFKRADSVALTVKYNDDIGRLTQDLASPFPQQILKVRAIFRWITDNIEYDYKFYNSYEYKGKEPKSFSCRGDSAACVLKEQVWENEYINKVLVKKKGVCQGYAMLFKKMCNLAGIDAEVVSGYVRTEYYEIGTPGNLDHAWNVVRLDGAYYLFDPTWAAGGCPEDEDGKLLPFHKQFNDYYWLTPPEEFAKNHYPEDTKWVLIANYKQDNFSANPYYSPAEVSNIKLLSPKSGIIHARKGDTVRFKIKYTGRFSDLQINTNIFQNPDIWTEEYVTKRKFIRVPDTLAIKKQQYVKYSKDRDNYEFTYVVRDYTLEWLDVLFDKNRVLRFKVTGR